MNTTEAFPFATAPSVRNAITRHDATLADLRAALPDCEAWAALPRADHLTKAAAAASIARLRAALSVSDLQDATQAARILWLIPA